MKLDGSMAAQVHFIGSLQTITSPFKQECWRREQPNIKFLPDPSVGVVDLTRPVGGTAGGTPAG